VNVLKVGTGIKAASEVQFSIFVAVGLLRISLVEDPIAIQQNHLRPIGENIL
jgi:hypothetical protein